MKNEITKHFYDKEISLLTYGITTDTEGGIVNGNYEVKEMFKGNVNFSNCKQIQNEYGLDYEIDISITTNYKSIKINDYIMFDKVIYNITDVLVSDSHVLLIGKIWQQ